MKKGTQRARSFFAWENQFERTQITAERSRKVSKSRDEENEIKKLDIQLRKKYPTHNKEKNI